jgi:hypothetical protein
MLLKKKVHQKQRIKGRSLPKKLHKMNAKGIESLVDVPICQNILPFANE